MGSRIPDPNAVPTAVRLRRLLEVSQAAARFYRRELFRDKKSWPREYLERGGALAQLDKESRWLVGYAPDSRSRLVDHLRATGFDLTTIRNAGLGIAEQLELLSGEASPVLVDDPLDAFAIENVSRLSGGRWAGIPLCGALLSAAQAQILSLHAATDTVIVVVSDDDAARQRAIACLSDLDRAFRRVQAVDLASGRSPAGLRMTPESA